MKISKLLTMTLASLLTLSSLSYAKKPDYEDKYENNEKAKKHFKEKKQKDMPYGLQKKVQRGGELPPGWKKKLQKGEVVDKDILRSGKVIYKDDYPYVKGTKVYEIEDKIIRVSRATREILEVFK